MMCAEFMLAKFTAGYIEGLSATEALVASGPRALTKAVLFPVRFMYTLAGMGHRRSTRTRHAGTPDEELAGR